MALLPYSLPKSVLFKMDPEAAHELTMAGLARFQNTPLACLWGAERVNDPVEIAGITFPNRIHAFLEDVANAVPKNKLRASGRDALATLEYTFAAIESYEQGGELVRPHALPPLKRDLKDQ